MTNKTTASEASESMAVCWFNSDGTGFSLKMAKVTAKVGVPSCAATFSIHMFHSPATT